VARVCGSCEGNKASAFCCVDRYSSCRPTIMSFLRRKEKNLIPPVEDNSSSYSSKSPSSAAIYNQSRDGPPPSYRTAPTPSRGYSDSDRDSSYSREQSTYRPPPKNDVYSRGERDLDTDRNELLGSYKPANRSNRFADGAQPDSNIGDGEEEDEETIQRATRFTKQESVNSTRNALRIAREAEETGRNTLLRLGDQSEKIANTERHLDVAKGLSNKAEDRADELKKLNRSIFRPAITFNKDAKRRAQELKIQNRYEEEQEERERAMSDIRQTQNRVGQAATYGLNSQDENDEGIMSPNSGPGYRSSRVRTAEAMEQRKRFQVNATASDDDMEDELDDNLEEISQATSRLKTLGLAMGQELDTQINRLERVDNKVGKLDNKIYNNTEKFKRIK